MEKIEDKIAQTIEQREGAIGEAENALENTTVKIKMRGAGRRKFLTNMSKATLGGAVSLLASSKAQAACETFELQGVEPAPDVLLPQNGAWQVTFNEQLDPATVNPDNVFVTGPRGERVQTRIQLVTPNMIRVIPLQRPVIDQQYVLSLTRDIMDMLGRPLEAIDLPTAVRQATIPVVSDKEWQE